MKMSGSICKMKRCQGSYKIELNGGLISKKKLVHLHHLPANHSSMNRSSVDYRCQRALSASFYVSIFSASPCQAKEVWQPPKFLPNNTAWYLHRWSQISFPVIYSQKPYHPPAATSPRSISLNHQSLSVRRNEQAPRTF